MFEGEAAGTSMPEDVQEIVPQEESNQENIPQEADSSLETLNTSEGDKPPKGYVPLAALHEARDQLKSLKESQDWRAYQELKTRLDADANYANYLATAASKYDAQNAQLLIQQLQQLQLQNKPDPYANYPQEIAEPLRKTQMLEQTVQQLLVQNQVQQQQTTYNQYLNRLNEKLTESKVPEHWKSYYNEKAHEIAAKINPNALSGYDAKLIDQVFSQIDQQVKQIQRAERGSYVVDKSRDVTPASTSSTGTAPRVNQTFRTPEAKANMITEMLRATN